MGFQGMGKSTAMNEGQRRAQTNEAGTSSHTGPVTHRSEFSPAIPRRVAPQQSPLPLRRLSALYAKDSRGRKASLDPRIKCQSCLRTGVSHVPGTNNNGPAMTDIVELTGANDRL